MNIYVANIPFRASESELKELFSLHGEVISAKIIIDKLTNRSRGFGFVEMADQASGKEAIDQLNGESFQGKELVVTEARPKTNDSRSGGFNSSSRETRGGYRDRGGESYNKW